MPTGQKPIRVLTVDDHALLRNGIRRLIGAESDVQLVAEASTGREAVEEFRTHRPDVTLMDLQMPDMNGIEAIIAIRGEFPEARIIVLSTCSGDVQVVRALKAGARAYLLKASFRNVNQIVRLAGADLLTISPDLLDQLEQTDGLLGRQLDPERAKASTGDRLHLDEKTFRWMHNEDAMATEKLAEGIRKFNADARHLQEYALSQVASNLV